MGSKSNFLENAVLDHLLNSPGSAFTASGTLYVGLWNDPLSDVSDGSAAGEVSGGSYARTAVTFGAAGAGAIANDGDVTFPTASASWNTVSGFAVCDSLTGGELYYWGDITTPKLVDDGDTAKFLTGDIDITED